MGKALEVFSSVYSSKRVRSNWGRVCAMLICLAVAVVAVQMGRTVLAAECFCTGKVGNINGDSLDEVSLGDAAMLVDHLYISGVDLTCPEEANIDGDSAGVIDMADVIALIDHLYITGAELPDCPSPNDYAVYFWDKSNEGLYFAYHPSTNEVDSFFIPGRGRLVVSADGKLGYRSTNLYIRVVSLDTLHSGDTVPVIASLSLGSVQAVSPDGQLVVAYKPGLSVLRTSDYTEVVHDSSLSGQVFSANSKRVYGVTVGTYYAFSMDLSDSAYEVTVKDFAPYIVHQIVPSPDEIKWYLYQATYGHQRFAVYDVAADSIIFSEILWPGSGDMAVTPNGKYVFYTNPGNMVWGPGDYDLRVYDVTNNEAGERVSTYGVIAGSEDQGVLLDFLCTTPDNRWLVMLCSEYPYASITVDTWTMAIVRYRCPEGSRWLEGISCQLAR